MKTCYRNLIAAAVTGLQLAAWGAAAEAKPAFMHTSGLTTQPIGHYEFCQREPGECRQRTRSSDPVVLTRGLWADMVDINNTVNALVAPRTDMEMWGRDEIWSYPDRQGDCEDYVLEKRRRLMQLGVPAGSLLITVVRQPSGDGHAVLTVRTDRGDFILDNMEPRILHWTETEYRYLKRQSEHDSGRWVSIEDSRQISVGAIRR